MNKFKDVKKRILQCIYDGNVLHEARNNIEIKNLLEVGDVSIEELAEIIKHTRGDDYEVSPHHKDQSINVHLIKTRYRRQSWYIKWFFIEPNAVFISVHQ
ncbi:MULTISPECIES: hypothetical protein [unclassified Oleiphilus]|jgi:hypothetical protein|uniref:hypothetical protein n=1 Tax=unclassified Oleiphilus TaxID=2631174 RepID=UPI0007C36657|nr:MULTISPECIES: hypothetical protein [unclassified Oleiphilus]KZY43300.1 hypothetical protein A3732_14595 [Oleiphilus sp. HI0050]KZY77135.1 hypothetical protein A3740_11040 [Oleiphilus sp. HI0068]KZY85889.1 hypothetical protein A3743_18240 [Oleiphilus sp. HI0072]KZY85953.1 hypothetical protein A3741_14710 [Oleiphilus sp. HI0069]KZZ15667.1 hypothetical protein A3749_05035 [Oleiphilus sp. HI0078]KZZ20150.1 hypothetical protein A3752_12550 [Oleiphilus sp. HI0081]KZZ47203.1 hypothetical protein